MDGYDIKCSFELLFRDLKKYGPPLTSNNEDRIDFSKKKILNKDEWKALDDLRKDDSIIITKLDRIIIINKLDYLNKMKELISDETKLSSRNLRVTRQNLEKTV